VAHHSLLLLSHALHAAHDVDEVMAAALQAIESETRYHKVWLTLRHVDQSLRVVGFATPALDFIDQQLPQWKLDDNPWLAQCFTSPSTLVWDDLRESELVDPSFLQAFGNRTVIVVPLAIREGLSGAFTVGTFADEGVCPPRDDEVGFIEQVASLVAAGVGRIYAEQHHALLQQRMQAAQRLQTLGRMCGEVSHDFNNMLVAIAGNTELASIELGPHPVQELLQEVLEGVQRASMLTRQLLSFSRGHLLDKRNLNLSEVVRDLSVMLRRLLPSSVRLQLDLDDEVWVYGDQGQLEQMVMNLVVNARDALPQGGRICLCTQRDADDDVGKLGWPRLCVRDDGQGLPAHVAQHLFEPHQLASGVEEGAGLGLAVVDSVLKAHGGEVRVTSSVDEGTRFDILFPPVVEATASDDDSIAPLEALTGDEHVLVVDDDPSVRRLLRRLLHSHGYLVSVAQSGANALEVLAHNDDVDLVVTDLMMPDMSGEELLQNVLSRPSPPACLAMSGYVREANIGDVRWVQKPFSSGDVLVQVRSLLDGRRRTSPAPLSPSVST